VLDSLSLRASGRWALANLLLTTPLAVVACDDGMLMDTSDGGTTTDASTPPAPDGGAMTDEDGGAVEVDAFVPPEPSAEPVFLLQGHMGRTAISCDDGQSWIHDTSLDDDARCFTDGLDCDHHAGSGKGLAWAPDGEGGGHFFATFGWGQPGGIDRSSDGVTWERKLGDTTFGGLAFMDDTLVAGSRTARVSGDRGETFSAGIDTGLNGWNARRAGVAGGRFVLVGDDSDVVWSEDGETWSRPDTLPPGCGLSIQVSGGILDLDGTIVIVGGDGGSCVSTDGGVTFAVHTIRDGIGSQAVVHDGRVWVWSRGEVHTSTDGVTWVSEPTTPADLGIGPVAVSDDGTFVGVKGGWQQWYEAQRFYRSTDGVTWEELPEGSYTGSHPVRAMAFGYVDECPE